MPRRISLARFRCVDKINCHKLAFHSLTLPSRATNLANEYQASFYRNSPDSGESGYLGPPMTEQVFTRLSPVRTRQRGVLGLQAAVWGLLAGSSVAIALVVGRWLGASISMGILVAVQVAAPLVGLVIGLAWKRTWHGAAVAVDQHYDLKDRTTTALAFIEKPADRAYHELQLQDTLEHLLKVEPQHVVPFRMPRPLPYALALTLVACVLAMISFGNQPIQAAPSQPDPVIVAEAEAVKEKVQELKEILKNEENPELEALVKELLIKAEEMKQPGVDVKEALAKLSEMQDNIQKQQAQFNTGMMEQQLQSLGDAMSAAQTLEAAAKALMEGKMDRAAQELEKINNPRLDRKELKTVVDKLAKAAEAMEKNGQSSLSQATSQFTEGLKKSDGTVNNAARKLAGECKKCEGRKKVSNLLKQCQSCLSACKGNCQKNSLTKNNILKKSNSPSTSFGMNTSGNIDGDKTSLDARRDQEKITGQQGHGESDIETTHEVEGQQQATRGYKDVYQKYRKMSESVLDSEEIPLGHRQMIRKYFELIRPQNGEGNAP